VRVRWRLLLCVCAVLLSACATQAQENTGIGPIPVGMTVHPIDEYYAVYGSTAAALRQSMRESGPASGGRRWDGYTRWNVRWRFRYAPEAGTCRVTEVRVEYTSTIVMPRWRPPPNASPMLRRDWDDFVRALRTHEEGHRNIGADAARQVMRRVGSVTAPSCELIGERANGVGRQTLEEYRVVQRQYDEETGHGRTQGARWPPR
jgi:predicted secreted Zn-dependent protease